MTLLVTVETGGMTQVLASRAGNVGGMVIGGWEETRVVSSPLVFQATLALLFLPSLLVGGLAIFGPRGVWGLVLGRSLFGRLVSRISSRQGLGLSLVGEVVSSVPSN